MLKGLDQLEVEIKNHFYNHLRSKLPYIQKHVRYILGEAVRNSPEYISLTSGQLKKELGLEFPVSKMEQIIDKMKESVAVTMNSAKGNITITIEGVPNHYLDLLGLSAANQMSEKGEALEWLRWLLLVGSESIVNDYYFKEPNAYEQRYSRAGGLMRAGKGSDWGIALQYAGTQRDNFISRSLESAEFKKQLEQIVFEAIK